MITAIIPARGGSKGIPRKNLVPLGGKPLIGWTIEQAQAAELVDEVIVTTDCPQIGEYAVSLGADWFIRSDATATDTASSESALLEVIECLQYEPELIVFLQATSPLRQPTDIDGAIRKLQERRADSIFSARYIEGYTWTAGTELRPNYSNRQPRQIESVRVFEENGSIYVFRPWVIKETRQRIGGHVAIWEMHPLDSFQVDDPSDLDMVEHLMRMRLPNGCVC